VQNIVSLKEISMFISKQIASSKELPLLQKITLIAVAFTGSIFFFLMFPTASADWHGTFYPTSRVPLNPYVINTFFNPPWVGIILFPFHFFSENIAQALNSSLNLVIIGLLVTRKKGSWLSLFLTLTSFPLVALLANGSIEWVPALGFLAQNEFGILLLLAKPQSGLLSGIDWFIQSKNKLLFFAFPTIFIIGSFFIWGNWVHKMLLNIHYVNEQPFGLSSWNISLFPWTIPIGLALVFYIFRTRTLHSELLGAIATYCFFPYSAPHSLTISFALLSASYPRFSILIWFLLWLFPVILHAGR
jgi:hypothetical protein